MRPGNRLLALSSAAVLTVYAAGYARTRPAADRLAAMAAERRPAPPVAVSARPSDVIAEPRPVAPAARADAPIERVRPSRKQATDAVQSTAKPANADAAPASGIPTPAESGAQPSAAAAPAEPAPAVIEQKAPEPAPVPATPPTTARYKDGTYFGWGTSRHGDIQASVIIENGRITSAVIAQCLTRYSCSWIGALPGQVVTRQSAEVDYVSGATQSTNAFYYAVVEALSKAK